ncbi:DUF4303 domain-containing protein [Salmonella enterica]|uniref:DUF4303 domain-containing protein n=1 Tax=Salmonella enterica TaxID=28901 RepID=UPI0012E61D39|nr:DUF4303 domain-containing protein [Salmonella enterica]ECA1330111.1 DUF4303 domain-containing protein [Salmonella enterica subsp. enterica serovar Leatherhead]ECU7660890.1 DUF4303 domain-containing protein [Salmonella enterica subsp. enterica serovar Bassadji]EDQ7231161.1 DUF4303 domain-containing protein [Salmonella enterica subsp. enterica]EDW2262474.1 DUF4303 domain-containing protein [Salmonella enterica subsp. enterica serovar Langford]EAU1471539.1 DUF4303 domain-containing protein [Sa
MAVLNDFQTEVLDAAKKAFSLLRERHPNEHFYAYSLYTDSSAMTIVPAANTIEYLDGILDEESENELSYYKWTTAEWGYEAIGGEYFKNVCRIIRNDHHQEEYLSHFNKICNDMMLVLQQLDKDGFFGVGNEREKVTLFITISDDDRSLNIENKSASILNSHDIYINFLSRFGGRASNP